ncbi:hypothetical protein JCM8097_007724 [Rhodosporidiobolus ruineniae]
MQRSGHPYAAHSEPPAHPPLPTTTTSSLSQQQPHQQLPHPLHHRNHHNQLPRLPTSSNTPALAHPPHPDSSTRSRGESSPAVSRHSNRPDPFDSLYSDGQGRPPVMRRQSSGPGGAGGTVSRRIVVGEDGREREETREERRARKERERAARGDGHVEGEARPLSNGAESSMPPPIPSSSSLPAPVPPSSSSSKDPPSTSSKSVLTIALQRAQSAVLLDSANNFPAAIAAYSQSVRLLKEVMARVEDGSREMERKLSTGGIREGESMDEFERRKQRYERKERAKVDEARRLRVIHDTYEDRIRMLVQMGTPLPPNTVLSPSLTSLASASSAASPELPPQPTSAPLSNGTSTAHPSPALSQGSFADSTQSAGSSTAGTVRPPSMIYRRHRSDREVPSVDGADEERRSVSGLPQVSEAPTSFAPGGEAGRASLETGAEGIGSAMLGGLEPTESGEGLPQIGALPVVSSFSSGSTVRGPTSGSMLRGSGIDDDQTLLAVSTGSKRRPGSALSDSTATPSTATATAHPSPLSTTTASPFHHQPTSSAPPPPSSRPPHSVRPSDSAVSLSSVSSGENDDQPLHTAREYAAGWPPSFPAHSRQLSAPAIDEQDDLAPLESSRRPSFASFAMRRGSSASAITTTSDATLRAPLHPGGESMRRAASAQSAGSAGTLEIRPARPSRSASLASSAAMAPSLSSASMVSGTSSQGGGGGGGRTPLVNPSTAEGTISQRRMRTPQPGEEPSSALPAPPQLAVRAPSSEVERSPPFAQISPPATKSPGFSAASLPGRLRALSQPGSKRPKLQSFDSEQIPIRPPVPPLLSTATRSTSAFGTHTHTPSASISSNGSAAASRKASIPTPTGLYPQLGRSNSSSSIGSSASSAAAYRQLNSGGAAETPTSAFFPAGGNGTRASVSPVNQHHHHAPHPSQSGGVYLPVDLPSPPVASSPSSREVSLSVPPVRRPFHLMRLLVATIPSSSVSSTSSNTGGGYLSEKLFVPAQIWTTQGGAKLVAIETKVRMLDLLSTGLDALDKAGKGLLLVPVHSSAAGPAARDEAARFARELEAFEGLAEGIQSTLGKKLGTGVIGVAGGGIGGGVGGAGAGGAQEKDPKTGRKGSTASFSAWSSKLSMSLNRVTSGVSLDSQATYVDAIAKVFKQAQCLDHHLSLLFPSTTAHADDPSSPSASSAASSSSNPYLLLATPDRHRLERQLRKASEFFGVVICRFVLRDTGVLLDKYVKRGGAWLSGE